MITTIWHKSQGFGQETKTQDIHLAYNPVARFYIIKIIITFQFRDYFLNSFYIKGRRFLNAYL